MKHRIVVCEDDPLYGPMIKRFHEEVDAMLFGDAELIVIQTLSMLQHLLATNGVSIIVMDLTLSDSRKEDTIEWVGSERAHLPPVYAITGDETMQTREKCLSMGFCGFALKKHVNESPNFFFSSLLNEHIMRLQHGR
jgi:DNA-binding NarL/FixJ family response regulator